MGGGAALVTPRAAVAGFWPCIFLFFFPLTTSILRPRWAEKLAYVGGGGGGDGGALGTLLSFSLSSSQTPSHPASAGGGIGGGVLPGGPDALYHALFSGGALGYGLEFGLGLAFCSGWGLSSPIPGDFPLFLVGGVVAGRSRVGA